ncbi:PREDICTED: C5a anaphylatoxin chemotactic receptor 1-like [Elephantulus edwardii]|uniref:C5a anaphylatoxin chemotactic receptor 1-like n=1 Tax=Elephantulus edwardii TaxID=28737 RepID=UPI0003F0CD3B|nr:PREDICTED: C5a anaphylatoxin chemotactic receptor 1-like [Elephantulus edwardii]
MGPHRTGQPMEDSSAVTQCPEPPGGLCPSWAVLGLLYFLVMLIAYLLDVASHGLLTQESDPHLPPSLVATWFGHQAAADVTFTVILPLTVAWTGSAWPLGVTFYRLDPDLAILTFYASGRLLTRTAAGAFTTVQWPSWGVTLRAPRTAVSGAGTAWLLLLITCGPSLRTWSYLVSTAESSNGTPGWDFPGPALNQLVFGFGVPLGVLSVVRWLVGMHLQLARLTGRPPLVGSPCALGALLFLCCFPFHLLLLLQLMGTREAALSTEDVWVLLRPLGFTLAGSSAFLNPLFYVCRGWALRQELGQALLCCHQEVGAGDSCEPA